MPGQEEEPNCEVFCGLQWLHHGAERSPKQPAIVADQALGGGRAEGGGGGLQDQPADQDPHRGYLQGVHCQPGLGQHRYDIKIEQNNPPLCKSLK